MSSRTFISCFFAVLIVSGAVQVQHAQEPAPHGSGVLVGHVYCADTDKPARFAHVTIEPVRDFKEMRTDVRGYLVQESVPSSVTVETDSDGSYTIEKLAPGEFYVLAELPGYLSPLTEFTREEISHPDEQGEKRLRAELPHAAIANDATTRMDFRLERGAAINGRVIYDDGSVSAGVPVHLLRRDKSGDWKPVSDIAQTRYQDFSTTDDQGHFRIASLRPGEYLLTVDIQRVHMESTGETLPGLRLYSPVNPTRIYSGDTARESKAKTITLRRGEDRFGEDITVPISKLYSVSGTVIAESDDHAIHSGKIVLQDTSDGTIVKEGRLNQTTGEFTLEYIPDGQYILKVTSATDGAMETGQGQDTHTTYYRWKASHSYADTQVPLQVNGNVSGIIVKLIDQNPATVKSPE